MKNLLARLIKQGTRLSATADGDLRIQTGNRALSDQDKEALKEHKAAIVAFLDGGKLACLSYPQERLWFLEQMGYGFEYHLPGIGHIDGALDVPALQRAIEFLVARHESLRTLFVTLEGVAAQHILPRMVMPFEQLDLSRLDEPERGEARRRHIQAFIEQPFDLERGPLIRALLIGLSDSHHILAFCMHHIISDGWSMRVLLRDLAAAYDAYRLGRKPDMPPLKLQYSGYALWQRETLTDAKLAGELEYWKARLTGYSNLDMPLDYTRPARLSGTGAIADFVLSQDLAQRIKQVCRARNTTPFTLFMAAVYVLLRKYSGQTDICMGMPVANRNHPDLENIIGFFVNTLVMRVNPADEPDPSLDALLDDVHRTIVDGQDHQNLPIEKVLEFLQPERDLGRSPIFQVLINYTPLGAGKFEFGNCTIEPAFEFESRSAKFELTFTYNEFEDGRAGVAVEYASDLFHSGTIAAMCARLERIIDAFAASPEAPLSALELVTADERRQVLETWNRTEADYPDDACLHEQFGRQARAAGKHIAVAYGDERLSYAELDRKSDQLAVYLQKRGVTADSPVGLCVPRSPELIVAILGILKAGGAYLPLDPEYPAQRLEAMLADSRVPLVLTMGEAARSLNRIARPEGCELLELDTLAAEIAAIREQPQPAADPQRLAYVIYTSGSTGQPKGVMVEHRSVVNHNRAVMAAYHLVAGDKVLQFSSVSFDIFVEEVFPTLLAGATLVMMDPRKFTDPDYLCEILRRHEVTVINLPTAYWQTLAERRLSGNGLRLAVVGGEKLDSGAVRKWRQANPAVRLINTYGPTETTVISTLFEIGDATDLSRPIPIGTPIANTRVYILDRDLKPVPIGMPGELYIAGAGLARGYWGNPDLTRERFLENPFEPGRRMYRTGDLARWLPDGTIAYLGRVDHQVKIRGFRVELGEIESALSGLPGVTSTAAVVVTPRSGGSRLVAYYTSEETAVGGEVLREQLRKRLPDYMLPAGIFRLEAMPLTPGGKIDRKRLEQKPVELDAGNHYAAPQTPVEQQLARIWEEVLGRERVGLNDNFFEIGGHSLLSVQLANKVNQLLPSSSIGVVDIIRYPTVRELAGRIGSSGDKPAGSPYVAGLRDSVPAFIIPGMPGLADGYHQLATAIGECGPVYGLQMKGYGGSEPARSVEDMAAHNIALIRDIKPSGSIRLYAHSYGGTVVYEMLRQLRDTEIRVDDVVLIDCGIIHRLRQIDVPSVTAFCRAIFENAGIDPAAHEKSIVAILANTPYPAWKTQLAELLHKVMGIAPDYFLDLWNVVETSLSVDYRYPHGRLPYRPTLVIAEESQGWLKPNCWDDYYDSVRVVHARGAHMSVITEPYCSEWVNRLRSRPGGEGAAALQSGVSPGQTLFSIRDLEKKYRKVTAVDGISFDIKAGACFGLLGPNGAGKTTTVEMLEGIIRPTSGSIHFCGRPLDAEYRKRIGIQFQQTALQNHLTVRETLQLFRSLYRTGLAPDALIAACSLQEFADRDTGKLSGGQRQRLLLAIALVNDPDVVFLDEPTTGLDPQARRHFWELIGEIKKRGKTIVLTTHYMEEAEQLCDEIAIMDHGRILVQDAPAALMRRHFDGIAIRLPAGCGLAERSEFPYPVSQVGDTLEFVTPDVEQAIGHLLQHQVPLEGLQVAAPNLEDLYLKLTGHSLRA
jgi:amino acid adenylation domain-containing protein